MFRSIRTAFITGLIFLLPIIITITALDILLDMGGTPASRFFFGIDSDIDLNKLELWKQKSLQVISLIIVFIIITILGYLSRIFLGQYFLKNFEDILSKVPLINLIYNTVKQIVDTFAKQKDAVFQEVVLLEYPRKGVYAVGFLTNKAKGEIQALTGEELVNVFVPTTPNPTSGFLLMLPKESITSLEMSISDGMKLIISGGVVVPDFVQKDNSKASI